MSEKELRDFDAWIGVNVFGKKAIHQHGPPPVEGIEDDYFVIEYIHCSHSLPHYTTDPAAAMVVLEKCAEKESERFDGVQIDRIKSGWIVSTCEVDAHAPTLPLAITLFAKKLFEK